MNNGFQAAYLTLLRRQVDEEIGFLVNNGHDSKQIHVPCAFCIERKQSQYICNRLNELRHFLSSIISNQTSKLTVQPERKRIGYEEVVDHLELPQNLLDAPLISIK